jgi:DNA-binding transcriptional MerR regulator
VPDCSWRIDDLARRAALTVDTIRYYTREGLLPSAVKAGKNKLYGQAHLDRIAYIKELQEKRFSLAAIKAIVTTDRPGLEGLFLGADHQYDLEEIVERSGLATDFVEKIATIGLLADPAGLGRQSYDDADLVLLRNVAELLAIGMTETVLVELGRIYVRHFSELQREVHAMLAGWNHPEWDQAEMETIQRDLTANASRMLPAVDKVLNYVHQRTVQRLTIEALRTAAATGTGVGGVKNVQAPTTSLSPD